MSLRCRGLIWAVRCAALAMLMLAMVAAYATPVNAGVGEGEDDALTYVVQPGDTLAVLAEQFGVSLRRLMHANGLQHPRAIYPGQMLTIPATPMGASMAGWRAVSLSWGVDLLSASHPTGVDPMVVARANRLLAPTRVLLGQRLLLPPAEIPAHLVDVRAAPFTPSRVAVAVYAGAHLWDVFRLNPLPCFEGTQIWAPGEEGATPQAPLQGLPQDLPYPLRSLSLSPQPVARGETAVLAVGIASQPGATVDCRVRYLDQDEACYGPVAETAGEQSYYGLIGLPSLMAVGRYTVTVAVTTSLTESVVMALPLTVSAGRYDYERLDLPSSRQTLLDPTLSQQERNKIAVLRTVRTPERYWQYPFALPLEGSVTSYYGSRRSYGYGFGSFHGGTDYRAEVGDPVLAPASGMVILAEPLVVRGNAILIDHGWGVVSGYWHLSRIDVAVGQHVMVGDPMGAVGNTGLSTGPHLHWELWVNGVAVNPLSWTDVEGPGAVLGAAP